MNNGLKAFKTGAGIAVPVAAYSRVKQVAAADANGFTGTVLLAGPYDETIGITDGPVNKAGDHVTVRLRNFPGSRKVICASICAIGDRLFATTTGQVDTLAAGDVGTAGAAIGPGEFIALEACATAGGVVEALPVASAGGLGRGVLFAATTDSAAVTNTLAETAFATNQFTLPANSLKVGDVIRFKGRAVVTAQHTTDTIAIKFYVGGVNVIAVAAFDPGTNDEIFFDGFVTVTAIGASGKIQGSGITVAGAPGTATARAFSLASTTLDTTATALVKASATWSAADAGNSVLLRDLVVELIRQ